MKVWQVKKTDPYVLHKNPRQLSFEVTDLNLVSNKSGSWENPKAGVGVGGALLNEMYCCPQWPNTPAAPRQQGPLQLEVEPHRRVKIYVFRFRSGWEITNHLVIYKAGYDVSVGGRKKGQKVEDCGFAPLNHLLRSDIIDCLFGYFKHVTFTITYVEDLTLKIFCVSWI